MFHRHLRQKGRLLRVCAGLAVAMCFFATWAWAQVPLDSLSQAAQNQIADSVFIAEVEEVPNLPDKVLHAEPLYIDLIRDLGARRGEKEWNVGLGMVDRRNWDLFEVLVEYEWAPAHRVGLEVELPFTLYSPLRNGNEPVERPNNRLNGLKMAAQWSFFVSQRKQMSMAIGYIHEFELQPFVQWNEQIWKGNLFNPFLITAKRWGSNWHSLLYAGPAIEVPRLGSAATSWQANLSIHYMLPGTRNFIGLETNQEWFQGNWVAVARPQMRLGVADNLLVGIVAGVPFQREAEGLSSFVRLIYEPGHRKSRQH